MNSKPKPTPGENLLVLAAIIILAVLIVVFASGCCVTKPTLPQKDSTVVYVRDSVNIIDKVVTRDSVVYIELPAESSQNILPTIMRSHLETSLAESDAFVDSLGLHHSLWNKKTPLSTTVPVTEHTVISDQTHQADSVATHTVYKEVERNFTGWERFRLKAFWWLIALCLVGFRREIFAIIKKII